LTVGDVVSKRIKGGNSRVGRSIRRLVDYRLGINIGAGNIDRLENLEHVREVRLRLGQLTFPAQKILLGHHA